jgi:membrane associated rhomboid family serine protease
MSSSTDPAALALLQLCAAAEPEPWYPRLYAKSADVDLGPLIDQLEELWLEGLIHKSPGTAETGPGITLTARGQEVVDDPEALVRLRAEDRGYRVRQQLRQAGPPWMTRVIVLIGLQVFGIEALLVQLRNLPLGSFLLPGGKADRRIVGILGVVHDCGAIFGADVVERQWWRFLLAGFVHFGLLHLALGMLTLYVVCRTVERMWGRLGCLLLWLSASVGGFLAAVIHQPDSSLPIMGSAPAWAGLCISEIVWLGLQRRYLTRTLRRQAVVGAVSSVLMLALFAFMPGTITDTWGLVGGAVAGTGVALLLHLWTFGTYPWRWTAPVLLLMLPVAGYRWLQHAEATDPRWEAVEDQVFEERYVPAIQSTLKEARAVYQDKVQPLVETHPTLRDPEAVEQVRPVLPEQRRRLRGLDRQLARAGPYHSPEAEQAPAHLNRARH